MYNPGKIVSIIMPVLNEERYIKNCIISLLEQDYPKDNMEWVFVDGMSTDRTIDIIKSFMLKYPRLIKLYKNEKKTVPFAMNIGIKESKGDYIIRLDAHAEYNNDYITKCVYYLETTDADNVGGLAETRSNGFLGCAIAKILSSKFGVGNSKFRTNGKSGYVDTVPFGAFRKEVFKKYGCYDERLTRNQDNEMNYRIRKNGGKVYLSEDIRLSYYCRDSIKGLTDMAIKNGKWNVITTRYCPGTMGIRHFIPMSFLLSLLLLSLLSIFTSIFYSILLLELSLYFLLDIFFSYREAKDFKYLPILFILFPIFHFSYGLGSLIGFIKKS